MNIYNVITDVRIHNILDVFAKYTINLTNQ